MDLAIAAALLSASDQLAWEGWRGSPWSASWRWTG